VKNPPEKDIRILYVFDLTAGPIKKSFNYRIAPQKSLPRPTIYR